MFSALRRFVERWPLTITALVLSVGGVIAFVGYVPRDAPLHERRICAPPFPCATVGIPAGECATVHGVTVCVGPDAGVSSGKVSP